MKRHGALLLLVAVLATLGFGLTVLFRLRLSQGDVFPPYSSQRADPLGVRALHDSLAAVPGLQVERSFRPLHTLAPNPPRTIVIAGLDARRWAHVRREQFDALDAAVRAGSRLVVAFRAKIADDKKSNSAVEDEENDDESDEDGAPPKKSAKKKKDDQKKSDEKDRRPHVVYADLGQRWGADLEERWLLERAGDTAVRVADPRFAALPAQVGWRSDVYFKTQAGAEWQEIYRRGHAPVLVERKLGLGSIVLAADAYFLSNEALQRDRSTPLLAWVIGSHARIVFDESHLGVLAEPGVAALARRYGLAGAFFTLVVLAALFVWRRMALFVPPAVEARDVALRYHPAAGLEALLRRAVPASEVVTAAVAEWRPTARASDRARVEAALAGERGTIVARYNAIVRALKRR